MCAMVVACTASRAETYVDCLARAGGHYGLRFNGHNVEAMPIRCSFNVLKPECKSSRQLGSARAGFQVLRNVWKHASITLRRKARIFDACIGSPLLYCFILLSYCVAEQSIPSKIGWLSSSMFTQNSWNPTFFPKPRLQCGCSEGSRV